MKDADRGEQSGLFQETPSASEKDAAPRGQTRVTAKRLLELLKRQDYRCALSGVELTPETASADHIVPVQRGGTHSLENIQIVDHKANVAKSTMTMEEFVALCRRVVEWHRCFNGSSEKE